MEEYNLSFFNYEGGRFLDGFYIYIYGITAFFKEKNGITALIVGKRLQLLYIVYDMNSLFKHHINGLEEDTFKLV